MSAPVPPPFYYDRFVARFASRLIACFGESVEEVPGIIYQISRTYDATHDFLVFPLIPVLWVDRRILCSRHINRHINGLSPSDAEGVRNEIRMLSIAINWLQMSVNIDDEELAGMPRLAPRRVPRVRRNSPPRVPPPSDAAVRYTLRAWGGSATV